ncbi:cytochrome c oxidase subunit 3 [Tianweitania populi]|uniref:Cytochrome c oxidase subunit III n=1 Tax=Tianweitania populi TaxID=1607949 RepID=A0A8J3GJ37_9HYPH|nr:cytochrome c oxidase subunit 3 [Tianweitania populi]GHD05028.1 cytochrome c oxidase subunit III [Tianweitania populi]
MTRSGLVEEPFSDPEQQRRAALFGMTIFLATEILLFGGIFAALIFYQAAHREIFVETSRELHIWIATGNTVVLLTSSLFAALAVAAAKAGNGKATGWLLGVTAALGLAFLGLKGWEYALEYGEGLLPLAGGDAKLGEPGKRLFMDLYLMATGLHAVHVTIGVCLLLFIAARIATRATRMPEQATTIEVSTLYWHLIDVIWVFLFPALYLVR